MPSLSPISREGTRASVSPMAQPKAQGNQRGQALPRLLPRTVTGNETKFSKIVIRERVCEVGGKDPADAQNASQTLWRGIQVDLHTVSLVVERLGNAKAIDAVRLLREEGRDPQR